METKPCECGKKMILSSRGLGLSDPPVRFYEWWCACGRKEDAPSMREPRYDARLARWEAANRA